MLKSFFVISVIALSILSLADFSQDVFGEELSPKKQIANGILPEDVTCKDELKKMNKINGDVICVNESSLQKLFDRHFAVAMPEVSDRFSKFADGGVIVMRSGEIDPEITSTSTISGGKGFLGKIDVNVNDFKSDTGGPEIHIPMRGAMPTNIDLALYTIVGSELVLDSTPEVEVHLKTWQNDIEHHKQVWSIFTGLIPEEYRTVEKFAIYSDDEIPNPAYVVKPKEATNWELWYSPQKMQTNGTFDSKWAVVLMIHEFAHTYTIGDPQLYLEDDITCPLVFENYYGCLKDDSLLYRFIDKFWNDIEFDSTSLTKEELYEKYPDRFVTEYAATNNREDIADSFTAFVLKDKPQGNSIKEQKILFFYEHDHLVDLRNEIRDGTSSPFHEQINSDYIDHIYGDIKVVTYDDGTVEYTWPNGSSQIVWSDGTIQISIPGEYISVQYPDGVIQWTMADGIIIVEMTDGTKQTTRIDGVIVTEWSDGTVQWDEPDGTITIKWTNDVTKVVYPDGTSEIW